jgi:IS605 OrfB family transposase
METEKLYDRKTVKVGIKPTQEQISLFYYLGECHADLFNMANAEIRYRIEFREQINYQMEEDLKKIGIDVPREELRILIANTTDKIQKRKINKILRKGGTDYKALCDWNTSVRQSLPLLAQVDCASEQCTLDRITGAWSSYRELKKRGDTEARPPKNRNSEFWFDSLAWKSGKIRGNEITLGHKIPNKPELKFKIDEYGLEKITGKELCRVEITREYSEKWITNSKWYLTLTYEVAKPEEKNINRILALDTGAGDIAGIDSRGRVYLQPMRRADKYWHKILKPLKSARENMPRGDEQRQKLQEKIRKIERKQSNQMNDFQRKLAHSIVEKADCFIIGKSTVRLGLAQSTDGSKKEHRGAQNTGSISRFIMLLKNKAKEQGKKVIEVPDAKFVEITDKAERKVLMALEHLKAGIIETGWEEKKIAKICAIAEKSATQMVRKFL